MKRKFIGFLFVISLLAQTLPAQERIDQNVIARIKTEGFQRSQAMDTLAYLTDVYGGRLTGSPQLGRAQAWARDKMSAWGLSNAKLEQWGTFGKGWSIERFSAEMTEPAYDRLNVFPLAWSPGTSGIVSGTPTVINLRSKADFDKYRGKLRNAIVFRGTLPLNTPESRAAIQTRRFTSDELAKANSEIDPTADGINGGPTTTFLDEETDWQEGLANQKAIIDFLKSEGIAALVEPSRKPNGVLGVQGYYSFDPSQQVPAFVMAREQYARIVRLTELKVPVRVELSLKVAVTPAAPAYNVVAEIPGTDPKLKEEVVLLGGHFDSWHSATGAIDNGAGCVAIMEALRILKAIGAKPRRTIRIALWDGEEQSYFGSVGYVKQHYGDPLGPQRKPEHDRLSAYFNLDNGSGKIRGIFLQGNEAARPIFELDLAPFSYLGSSTLSVLNTGGTDHMVLDAVGLPGFQFIQDPLDYDTRIHHTNLDVLEAAIEEDLKTNAVIIASVAYHTAMRDERIPRKDVVAGKAAAIAK